MNTEKSLRIRRPPRMPFHPIRLDAPAINARKSEVEEEGDKPPVLFVRSAVDAIGLTTTKAAPIDHPCR